MEFPEQDRQAFIDAARRRSQPQQGGAAFGVYPSSGKRPEKLNVSRDVNMPAQAARGWVAGTLGLPGDIESLGRMAVNFAFGPGGVNVDETPVLPTSDFYREWLPGYDPAPAAKFASGLGALAGGAGSTKVAGTVLKGAKATGKALGPKAAEMAESYLKKSGLAPELIAYQGSPHKFAPEPDAPFGKFKAEKIGTGEGAQAYGHGHYTAESKDVAQSYADVLASPRNRVRERRGVYIEPSPISGGKYMLATRSEIGQPRGLAADATQFIYPEKEFSSIAAAIKFAKRKGLLSRDERPKLTAINEDSKYVPVTKAADVAEPEYTQFIASDPGYLYTVDIPDEKIARMLDLDRPLAEQSPEVQKALSNVSGAEYAAEYFAKNRKEAPTGADLQEFLRLSGMNPPEISAKMLEAGIPGVKYLDEGSRGPSGSGRWNIKFPDGTEQIFNFKPSDDVLRQMNATAEPAGTRNFVIFPGEEESVKIIERKAKGGLVEDTDAIAAKLTGMDKDKALTHALRMANAKQEAHMAAGGLAKVLKGAKAAEEAAKASKPVAPVIMPPVPGMTKEQMRPIAQRVASQMTGEFVRPNPKLSINPAGKSQKVFQRERDLPVEIVQKIPQKPAQPIDIEKYEGYGLVGVPGDPTIGGVAKPGSLSQIHEGAAELRKLGDVEFQHPVQLFGGPRYGAYNPGEEFWASNIGPARTLQNRITATSEALDAPVLGQYIKMSPESTNFALHNLDALLSYMEPEKLSKSKLRELNEEIRKGSPDLGQFPGFAGFEDPIDVLLQSQIHSDLRKHIAETLMKPTVAKKYGLRPGSDVLFGISKPELRELEAGISGYSVGQMKPGAELTPSLHPTYDYDIPGTFIGQSKYPTPYEIAFPASTAYTRSQLKPGVQEFNMLKMVGPREKIDPQYIDQIKMYEELMKEYTGKKKGGLVKKSGLSVLNKAII